MKIWLTMTTIWRPETFSLPRATKPAAAAAPPSHVLPPCCRRSGLPEARAARGEGGSVAFPLPSSGSGRARLAGPRSTFVVGGRFSRRRRSWPPDPASPRPDLWVARQGRVEVRGEGRRPARMAPAWLAQAAASVDGRRGGAGRGGWLVACRGTDA